MTVSAGARWRVGVPGGETTAVFEPTTARQSTGLFVCAHGAGGHMDDGGMLSAAAVLRARGLGVVRFNFLYRENKSGRPDPMPRLEACIEAVVARARAEVDPETLILGGRSMGGRAASVLAAKGFACDGLLLLAYPLHPAGKPDQLRTAHLPSIRVPVLCVNGTRDALCRRDLMEAALATIQTRWRMHWVEGGDHSFHVLRTSGRSEAQVLDEIGDVSHAWMLTLAPSHR